MIMEALYALAQLHNLVGDLEYPRLNKVVFTMLHSLQCFLSPYASLIGLTLKSLPPQLEEHLPVPYILPEVELPNNCPSQRVDDARGCQPTSTYINPIMNLPLATSNRFWRIA